MSFLTINEVANRLNVEPKTIRRWIKEGTLTAAKMGRIWRIDPEDLEKFIQKAKEGK